MKKIVEKKLQEKKRFRIVAARSCCMQLYMFLFDLPYTPIYIYTWSNNSYIDNTRTIRSFKFVHNLLLLMLLFFCFDRLRYTYIDIYSRYDRVMIDIVLYIVCRFSSVGWVYAWGRQQPTHLQGIRKKRKKIERCCRSHESDGTERHKKTERSDDPRQTIF